MGLVQVGNGGGYWPSTSQLANTHSAINLLADTKLWRRFVPRRPTRIADGRPAAIVIGVDCLQGLQTARVLAGRGLQVIGVAKDARHYGCRTRACDQVLIGDTGGDGLIDTRSRPRRPEPGRESLPAAATPVLGTPSRKGPTAPHPAPRWSAWPPGPVL